MKITPAMLEAGVAAMARIKRQKPQDAAVVNAVFSAMHSAMLTEQKRLAGLETPKPYEHQDWPKWVQGPNGESRIFDKAEDVPEGWGGASAPLQDKAALADLRAAYKVKFGKGPFMGWSAAQLLEKMAANGPDPAH